MITDTTTALAQIAQGTGLIVLIILGVAVTGIAAGALVKGVPFAWGYFWRFIKGR